MMKSRALSIVLLVIALILAVGTVPCESSHALEGEHVRAEGELQYPYPSDYKKFKGPRKFVLEFYLKDNAEVRGTAQMERVDMFDPCLSVNVQMTFHARLEKAIKQDDEVDKDRKEDSTKKHVWGSFVDGRVRITETWKLASKEKSCTEQATKSGTKPGKEQSRTVTWDGEIFDSGSVYGVINDNVGLPTFFRTNIGKISKPDLPAPKKAININLTYETTPLVATIKVTEVVNSVERPALRKNIKLLVKPPSDDLRSGGISFHSVLRRTPTRALTDSPFVSDEAFEVWASNQHDSNIGRWGRWGTRFRTDSKGEVKIPLYSMIVNPGPGGSAIYYEVVFDILANYARNGGKVKAILDVAVIELDDENKEVVVGSKEFPFEIDHIARLVSVAPLNPAGWDKLVWVRRGRSKNKVKKDEVGPGRKGYKLQMDDAVLIDPYDVITIGTLSPKTITISLKKNFGPQWVTIGAAGLGGMSQVWERLSTGAAKDIGRMIAVDSAVWGIVAGLHSNPIGALVSGLGFGAGVMFEEIEGKFNPLVVQVRSKILIDFAETINIYAVQGTARLYNLGDKSTIDVTADQKIAVSPDGSFGSLSKFDKSQLSENLIAVLHAMETDTTLPPAATLPQPVVPSSGYPPLPTKVAGLTSTTQKHLQTAAKPRPYEGQLPPTPFPQREVVQQYDNGTINWSKGTITAVGIGAPPPNAVNMAQARAMARRAAIVVARRNLLELVQGVQIDSMTLVKEAVVQSDIIRTSIQGVVRNAQIVGTDYMSDGSVEVKVAMNMSGQLANTILPQYSPAVPWATGPSVATVTPETLKPSSEILTGLVVDARGLGARPAMSPKIVDETGKEIYGSAMVNRQYAVQQGMTGYSRDLSAAQGNSRVTANPLTVKGLRSVGPGKSDIVISNRDASRILSAAENLLFMQKCRVMIVVD